MKNGSPQAWRPLWVSSVPQRDAEATGGALGLAGRDASIWCVRWWAGRGWHVAGCRAHLCVMEALECSISQPWAYGIKVGKDGLGALLL